MTSDIQTMFQCPYCPGSAGVVAVDLHALAAAARDRAAGAYHAFDLNSGQWPPFLVFDPDGAAGRPCRHMVQFWLEGRTYRRGHTGRRRVGYAFDVDWAHAWWAEHDRDGEANGLMWEEGAEGVVARFAASAPHRMVRVEHRWRLRGGPCGRARMVGYFVVAAEPEVFMAGLRQEAMRHAGA